MERGSGVVRFILHNSFAGFLDIFFKQKEVFLFWGKSGEIVLCLFFFFFFFFENLVVLV